MGFQYGNLHQRKPKLCFDALMIEMKECEDELGMRVIARKLLRMAVDGDIQAIKEVMNRIDGMPVQQAEINSEHTIFVAALPPTDGSTAEWMKIARSAATDVIPQ